MAEVAFAYHGNYVVNIPGKSSSRIPNAFQVQYTASHFAKMTCSLNASPNETLVHSLTSCLLFACPVASQNEKHTWLQEPFSSNLQCTPGSWARPRSDHFPTIDEPLQSSFGTGLRPPPLKGLCVVALVHTQMLPFRGVLMAHIPFQIEKQKSQLKHEIPHQWYHFHY